MSPRSAQHIQATAHPLTEPPQPHKKNNPKNRLGSPAMPLSKNRTAISRCNAAGARANGFTLVELVVVVVILSILTSIAMPSFLNQIRNTQLQTQSSDLVAALNMARSEAVRRNGRVTVCALASNTACATTAVWNQGWLVFSDPQDGRIGTTTSSKPGIIDTGDAIIKIFPAVSSSVISAGSGSSQTFWISYKNDGSAESNRGATIDPIVFCNRNVSLNITITFSGLIKVGAKSTC